MKTKCVAAIVCLLLTGHVTLAQSDRAKPATIDASVLAVQELRSFYFSTDYHGGAQAGDRLVKQFPHSRAVAAWRIANLARSDRPVEAEKAAAKLLAANRTDAWGWFARTMVNANSMGASTDAAVLAPSLEAYSRAPANPDVIWLRAYALANNDQAPSALAFIEAEAAKGPLSQAVAVLRGTAMYNVATATRKRDATKVDSAFALYARARDVDSTDVTAYTFASSRMMNAGRMSEAYPLAKRAVALAPLALSTHEIYWRAVDTQKDLTQAQRDSEALGDVETLVRVRGTMPSVLASAARQYEMRKQMTRARELEDRVLAEHPTSMTAEWIHVSRYRALATLVRDTTKHDSSLAPRYDRALWAFVDRPVHVTDRLLGDAYRELFYRTDSTSNADTLLRIVRGMVKYEGINPHIAYADGAIRLAERGRDFKEAEQIARAGLKEGRTKIDGQRSVYETVGDYAAAQDRMAAQMYDAVGVVYARQKRTDEAEKQFEHAHDLDPGNTRVLFHLAELTQRRGQLAAAEQLFIKGALISTPGTNRNRAALQSVYRAKTGSLDGYDKYLAGIEESDRAVRRAEVAKSRSVSPSTMKPFQLKTVDGKPMTLDSLRGKVVAINAWGMWCGPCVAEMPELQKLATRYAHDSTVQILTIDNDPNTDELRSWMQKKGYTMTTLLDDGYLSRFNLHTFPTTWFLDREGRIAFTKVGWSEKLVEEFGWRIEMLKAP